MKRRNLLKSIFGACAALLSGSVIAADPKVLRKAVKEELEDRYWRNQWLISELESGNV